MKVEVSRDQIAKRLADDRVKFLRLQFVDLDGSSKNVEVPETQFEKALDGQIMFDGSSIDGFTRIEESDMLLKPDLSTYIVFPWGEHKYGRVARLICDVANPDDSPFDGCPRTQLKRATEKARQMGYSMVVGPEAEFFLFERDSKGKSTTITHDAGGYFDLTPVDKGEACRRDIVQTLEEIGFEVEAAHHEVAPGQHEIDFRYGDALSTADNLITFKMVVRKVANDHNLHATFMPKPLHGVNGSGMHCHQSLFFIDESNGAPGSQGNAFYDPNAKWQLSATAMHYIGGIIEHAEAICAITNPIINSYKRLVPGYEAPINIAWSERNRSPMIRIPARRGVGARIEIRMPDPACNPYLGFAAMLRAGLDGIERKLPAGDPVNENIFAMTTQQKSDRGIRPLPGNLRMALDALERDTVIVDAIGKHLATHFIESRRREWQSYIAQVHEWELNAYLNRF